jgi:hypothetical protein
LRVSHRLPVFVSGLTACDYLLWSWSSSGNHATLALISGLTLPPLAALCAWQLLLSVARLIAARARRSPAAAGTRASAATAPTAAPAASLREEALASASAASSQPASRTLAA